MHTKLQNTIALFIENQFYHVYNRANGDDQPLPYFPGNKAKKYWELAYGTVRQPGLEDRIIRD